MPVALRNLRGGAQLAFSAAAGLATAVEQMHETIARRPLPWNSRPDHPSRAHGIIASGVYAVIQGVLGATAKGVDLSLRTLPKATAAEPDTARVIRCLAALNGVCGDHLEATGNPLAIAMEPVQCGLPVAVTPRGLAAAYPDPSPHIAVLLHGLCLSELGWCRDKQPDIGSRLHDSLGLTPVCLRYNSGRHISTNGQQLAGLLDELCSAWPLPVESLSLIGHSMGGLVIRSACWYGHQAGRPWLEKMRRAVYLGTPHHGSPVERAGHLFDLAMRSIQYVEPLSFGGRRSAGIKDLRYGNLLDEDWLQQDSGHGLVDRRLEVPLLNGVDHYFAAASVGRHERDPIGHLLGDWLVRSGSALGAHANAARRLSFRPENCRIFHAKGHLDLLSDAEVHAQILDWFAGAPLQPGSPAKFLER
jgi:pimeloyl-ACP methyl ester carboxylesterase